MAVRHALGAGRWRLVSLLLSETLLVTLAAAGLSLLAVTYALPLLLAEAPGNLSQSAAHIVVGPTAILFATAVSALVSMFVGLWPALAVSRARSDAMRAASTARADEWLTVKKPTLAERSYVIEKANLKHLLPVFGKKLITDIDGAEISRYQQDQLGEKASPKTVNLEIGMLRAVLRRNRLWAAVQPDVRMLQTQDDIGKVLAQEEEKVLLAACGESRSKSLLPAVTLAVNTGMRYTEIRLLRRQQLDFVGQWVTVGKSKTDSGSGRIIPLNARAVAVLEFWASSFPNRQPAQYVWKAEPLPAAPPPFHFKHPGASGVPEIVEAAMNFGAKLPKLPSSGLSAW